ncbi:unnamed protein product [Dracunculus medinensis]|uniref:SCP domain-containing protein n=1 Tax=Dracunculus medinensis TaxID=318479 RepID=A0A0N4URP3_DRAME|nr:unnamed protein product [Dracunculus medinensis]
MLLAVAFFLFHFGGLVASKCPASKITKEMRSYVLKEHNKLSSQLANAEAEASNGLMPSSNVHELEWDCGLEERAQQWAEYCDFEHSTQEFRNYSGENLYARWEYEEPKLGSLCSESRITLTSRENILKNLMIFGRKLLWVSSQHQMERIQQQR